MLIPTMMSNRGYLNDVFDDFMFPRVKENVFEKMRCDIYEKDSIYYLEMDIPGFDRNDINVEIDDNYYLTITAEKNHDNTEEDESKNYIRKERSYGKYQRTFYIGGIDKDNIEAEFVNGILKVKMPRKAEENLSNKRIEIK